MRRKAEFKSREQKIKEEALAFELFRYEGEDPREIFETGAKWADKHPENHWIELDGKHKEPPYGTTILVYYPIGNGTVDLVERSKEIGKPDKFGNYESQRDEFGLPVLPPNQYTCNGYYNIRATKWFEIPVPKKSNADK